MLTAKMLPKTHPLKPAHSQVGKHLETHACVNTQEKRKNKKEEETQNTRSVQQYLILKHGERFKHCSNLLGKTHTHKNHIQLEGLCSTQACPYELNRARIPSRHHLICATSYSWALTYHGQSQFALITQSTRHRRPLHTVEEHYIPM